MSQEEKFLMNRRAVHNVFGNLEKGEPLDPNTEIYHSLESYIDGQLQELIQRAEEFFTERLTGMKTKEGRLDFHNTLLLTLAGAVRRRQSLFEYGRLLDSMSYIGEHVTCIICGKPIPCEHTSVSPKGEITTTYKPEFEIMPIGLDLHIKEEDDG